MNFNLTPPEPDFILCENCDSEIYEGETVFTYNAKDLCKECFREKLDIYEAAEILGAGVWVVGDE